MSLIMLVMRAVDSRRPCSSVITISCVASVRPRWIAVQVPVTVPPEIPAAVVFRADYGSGTITTTLVNVDRFDRVRIRKALAEADWLDPLAISRSASHLAEANEALEHATDAAVRDFVTHHEHSAECVPPPDREIALRVVGRIIKGLGGSARGGDIDRLLDRLERSESGNVGGVHAEVQRGRDEAETPRWIFRPEPSRRSR